MIIKHCVHNCMLLFFEKGVSRSRSLLRLRRATAIGVLLRMPYYSVLRFKVYAEKLVNKIKIKSEVRN